MKGRARRRRFAEAEMPGGSMTSMIDVVFLLLVYFLVTFSASDELATIGAVPPGRSTAKEEASPRMIRIEVRRGEYRVNGRVVSAEALDALLGDLAAIDVGQTVLVSCSERSLHGDLVRVLDRCSACRLTRIAVAQ